MAERANRKSHPLPKSALVVDSDGALLSLVKNHLEALGVENVATANDGNKAWSLYLKYNPEIIIMDWHIPSLSGVGLFNRIRHHQKNKTLPILAISGTMVKHDFSLLQEMPCTAFLPKPFSKNVFAEDLKTLQSDYNWHQTNQGRLENLLQSIPRDGAEAIKRIKEVMATAPNPIPVALIAAEKLREFDFFPEAAKFLQQILKLDPSSVIAMNELGKVLHLMGRHEDALKFLENASEYSPLNLERLCLTGQINLDLNRPSEARDLFRQVLDIDETHEMAQLGIAATDHYETVIRGKTKDKAAIPHNFASLMNTMAVAKVRAGKFKEGIDQYRKALSFLHSRDIAARLAFNVGLGYLRWGKPDDGLPWFLKALDLSDGTMVKAKKYIVAIQNGSISSSGADTSGTAVTRDQPTKQDQDETSDVDQAEPIDLTEAEEDDINIDILGELEDDIDLEFDESA